MGILKPFTRWGGGKTMWMKQIVPYFPPKINYYIEPFVGAGGSLLYVIENYHPDRVCISDLNADLIRCYEVIRDTPTELCEVLEWWQNFEMDKDSFLNLRKLFNDRNSSKIEMAAYVIVLGRRSYYGLLRINKEGLYTNTYGDAKNYKLYSSVNIHGLSKLFQNIDITHGSYKDCLTNIDPNSFIYFDPPYRPTSKTAKFTSYNKEPFLINEQIELAEFCLALDCDWAVSNSYINEDDDFYQTNYKDCKINIIEVFRGHGTGLKRMKEVVITPKYR